MASLALLVGCRPTLATTGPLPPDAGLVARVDGGRALGRDATGSVYVVEAGRAAVTVTEASGLASGPIGGPGTGPGTFIEPSDVDPTSGLAVFVADAAAGTVQRFTESRQSAETVAIPDVDPTRAAPSAEAVQAAAEGRIARGRPVGVAALPGGGLAIVEASRGVVLVLDARRRLERVVGAGTLRAPVGVAADADGALWVADAGASRVVVFTPYGEFVRTVEASGLGRVQRVRRAGRGMLVVGAGGVLGVDALGATRWTRPLALGEPVVDAALDGDALFVLTPTRLVRVPRP